MATEIGGDTAVLEFAEGTALAGATVRVSLDMDVRDFLALQRRVSAIQAGDIDEWEKAYEKFASTSLVDWDLTRKGAPITADLNGFLSLPFSVANRIFTEWVGALTGPGPNSAAASASTSAAAA